MPLGGLLLGGAAVGVGGAVLGAATGQGKTGFRASDFADTGRYDPTGQYLGSDPDAANRHAADFGGLATGADRRGLIQADNGLQLQDRGMGIGSRADQQRALELMRLRATGQVPSFAQMQGQRALNQGMANNMSMAASARGGPGAMALAARGAGMNNAQMSGDVAGSSAIAAVKERDLAEQGYMTGAGAMRNMDLGQQGLDQQFALGQGQLALGSQGQNDARAQALRDLQMRTLYEQAQLRMQNQGMLAGSHQSADTINGGINTANAGAQAANYQGIMGSISGGIKGIGKMYGGGQPGQQGDPAGDAQGLRLVGGDYSGGGGGGYGAAPGGTGYGGNYGGF